MTMADKSSLELRWQLVRHDELSASAVYAMLRLRSAVFVVEQQCIFLDIDDLDLVGDNWHLLAWRGSQLVGCLRMLDPAQHRGDVVIGRIATDESVRGSGIGHELMSRALAHCASHWRGLGIHIGAQAHLQSYYGRHGFVINGEPYLEDGIPHVPMCRAASIKPSE